MIFFNSLIDYYRMYFANAYGGIKILRLSIVSSKSYSPNHSRLFPPPHLSFRISQKLTEFLLVYILQFMFLYFTSHWICRIFIFTNSFVSSCLKVFYAQWQCPNGTLQSVYECGRYCRFSS